MSQLNLIKSIDLFRNRQNHILRMRNVVSHRNIKVEVQRSSFLIKWNINREKIKTDRLRTQDHNIYRRNVKIGNRILSANLTVPSHLIKKESLSQFKKNHKSLFNLEKTNSLIHKQNYNIFKRLSSAKSLLKQKKYLTQPLTKQNKPFVSDWTLTYTPEIGIQKKQDYNKCKEAKTFNTAAYLHLKRLRQQKKIIKKVKNN